MRNPGVGADSNTRISQRAHSWYGFAPSGTAGSVKYTMPSCVMIERRTCEDLTRLGYCGAGACRTLYWPARAGKRERGQAPNAEIVASCRGMGQVLGT